MRYGHIVMSLFCAWVLWSHKVELRMETPQTYRTVGEWYETVNGYEARRDCSQVAASLTEKVSDETLSNGHKLGFNYFCLPDTVDPSAPK